MDSGEVALQIGMIALILVGIVVMDRVNEFRSTRATEARRRRRAREDELGSGGWEEQLPSLLATARDALERLGLSAVESSEREDDLRAWSSLHLRDEPEVLFEGLTGRGERAGCAVAATVSASRGLTFSDDEPRVAVLWELDLSAHLPGELDKLRGDHAIWGGDHQVLTGQERPGCLGALFEGFEGARAALEAPPDATVDERWLGIVDGVFLVRMELEYPAGLERLGDHLARLASLSDAVQWRPEWSGRDQLELFFLERAPSERHGIFAVLLKELLERPEGRDGAVDELVARARALDGEALLLLGWHASEHADRLDGARALEYLDAMAPTHHPRDVGWAIGWLPAERWIEADRPPKLRAEILGGLLQRGEDGEALREALAEVMGEPELSGAFREMLLERAVEGASPALLRGALSDRQRVIERLARDRDHQALYEEAAGWVDHALDTVDAHPELARSEREPLEALLVDALEHLEGERWMRAVRALGEHGARRAAPALAALADGGLLELSSQERGAAEDALGALLARVGEAGDGGLSVADGQGAQGALSVAAGPDGALSQAD